MNVLVINCGSSSIKYQVLNAASGECLLQAEIESVSDYEKAMQETLVSVASFDLVAVGHRVVHGGDKFQDAVLIDDDVLAGIEEWAPMAPLHNPVNLAGIKASQAAFPDLPQVAVFDTAFHAGMPRRSYTYALDQEVAQKQRIRRYGFHGTSHAYVAELAASYLGRPLAELRLVSLHLGNGASACAIEYGHSTATSMGMTPLDGLVMGTRCGDLDAGVVLHLMRSGGYDVEQLDHLLNKESGLKGLSGISHDLREIESAAAEGDDRARMAIAVFAHRVRQYIGAYATVMGGIDGVIITGGIGENSVAMRRRILQRLDFLGLSVNEDANSDVNLSDTSPVALINTQVSRVKALVVKTNEELMIAKQTQRLVDQQRNESALASGIPIAISARHIHLSKETFAELFGPDAEPTHYKDISQPGQYACKETVAIVGPRNRIEKVRLLGPLRSKNQIEISRTDEFFLGVDAPIRDSGRTKGSAPITVVGPKATVHLEEGLICARRHIHMAPEDAQRYNVKSGDEVEVAVSGGPRDLVFCDVLVRVSPGYKLEMHIDTDEANAAELNSGTSGELVYSDTSACAGLRALRTFQ